MFYVGMFLSQVGYKDSPSHIASTHCSKCGGPMQLARVQEDERGWELHLYECTRCNSQESHIVKK